VTLLDIWRPRTTIGRADGSLPTWNIERMRHSLAILTGLTVIAAGTAHAKEAVEERPKTGDKLVAPPAPAKDAKPDSKSKSVKLDAKADAKADVKKPEPPKDASPADLPVTPVGEDALRLGPFTAPPRPFPFPLLGDERAREVYVDRAGELYKLRPYSGLVPDWNTAGPTLHTGQRCKIEAQALTWVGFQNNADGSRVFVQTEREACGYVYRPDDRHVVVDLPQVAVANANLKREILTGAFPTAVELVKVEEVPGRGSRVIVVLKERRAYLSAHLGRYLFLDVPR
jgi:hypothetical protein